ncbi:E3 ubiquitin-protein ligase hrd1 [Linnemannia exigua]|uniref:RING-type E3 ubiquitin transferase n=1 Tax=Linnemannia exigua TaxID=604196 RepID=A0AAD4D6M9_9FUNG|nr:E3 ubiquitin-protein ligase hrd1 [Linnemannia exigua]
MARLAVYGAISTLLAGGVIASAFAQRSNFYSACIYLYKSNACMMIILNLGLFLTIVAGQLVLMVFFGKLRALEVEHLYERAWYAVTETCLAMTIFKDEFDTRFVVMFTLLLFLKVFHWLCQDRVDSMEQSPEIPLSFHVRMVTIMTILVSLDILLVLHAIDLVAVRGPNMMIMFGFEYTLLATSLMAAFGKYVLHTIDMRREDPWENKSMLLFYLDLVADFIKLVTYLMFFVVILVNYGLPLHIIRDVYMTMRSFLQKCKDLIQYRKATRNMNERYPDASRAELAALSDPICIICREEMVGQHGHTLTGAGAAVDDAQAAAAAGTGAGARPAGSNTNVPKKLPCGHIFHFHCLKSWLERQQSCPTCRRLVLDPPTPAPTPVPAVPGEQAANGVAPGAAGAPPAPAPGQALGGVPGFGGFGNNAQPGPAHPPHPGMGYPLFAPQGHYPLAGWHPQAVGGAFPGAIPPEGQAATTAGTGTGGTAGTGAGASTTSTPGATPMPHPGFIPSYTIPNVTHPIPGFIPLFPVGHAAATPMSGLHTQAGGVGGGLGAAGTPSSTFLHGQATADQIPLTSLDALTEDQLKYLEENTRRGLQERLRVLQAVEIQIAESVGVLNRVLGALPPAGTPFRSETADPPSPTMPAAAAAGAGANSSAGPNGTARNWVFGSVGPALNTASSPVGLQSLARSTSHSNSVNGASTNGHHAHGETTNGVVNGGSNTDGSKKTSDPEAVPNSTSPSPIPSAVTTAAGISDESSLLTALNGGHETEAIDIITTTTAEKSKGKGRKSDAELEQDLVAESRLAHVQEQEQEKASISTEEDVVVVGEDEEDEDEDNKYSPQEMVKRRWAGKPDVSSSE